MEKELKIEVLSREKVQQFVTDLPHIVISVRDPGSERAKLPDNPNRIAELYLDFDDYDKQYDTTVKLVSKEDAKAILGVLKVTEPYINLIVVNCEAGISRSSAIAAAISVLLKLPDGDSQYFNPRGPFCPNRLVYRTLLNTAIEEDFHAPES